jgi:hypothetical protein
VATRQAGNEVFYLVGDQLGSASLVADWQGNTVSEVRYTPWGEMRWAWDLDGAGYTNRLYTSQLADSYGNICEQQEGAMTYEEIFVKLLDEFNKPPPAFAWQQMLQNVKQQNPTLKMDLEQQVSEQEAAIIIDNFRRDWKAHNEHFFQFHSAYLKEFLK